MSVFFIVFVFVLVFVFVVLIHFLIAIIISFQKMYGFGGLGELEVEIWSDVTMAGWTNDKKER